MTNATISYHTEATEKEKEIVKNNIKFMSDVGYRFRINLMFHKDYFDECIKIADWFDKNVRKVDGHGQNFPPFLTRPLSSVQNRGNFLARPHAPLRLCRGSTHGVVVVICFITETYMTI